MGSLLHKESNESPAVKRQAEGFSNPMYQLLNLFVSYIHSIKITCLSLQGGGLLFELSKKAMATGNTVELDEAIRSKVAVSDQYCANKSCTVF